MSQLFKTCIKYQQQPQQICTTKKFKGTTKNANGVYELGGISDTL